jgi:hypothetical protein
VNEQKNVVCELARRRLRGAEEGDEAECQNSPARHRNSAEMPSLYAYTHACACTQDESHDQCGTGTSAYTQAYTSEIYVTDKM